MEWINLTTESQFENILKKSSDVTQVIYKHSYACGISSVTKHQLEKNSAPEGVGFYFLDVLQQRVLSRFIARRVNVQHESPQVLVIRNGQCVYSESHLSIKMAAIRAHSLAA